MTKLEAKGLKYQNFCQEMQFLAKKLVGGDVVNWVLPTKIHVDDMKISHNDFSERR